MQLRNISSVYTREIKVVSARACPLGSLFQNIRPTGIISCSTRLTEVSLTGCNDKWQDVKMSKLHHHHYTNFDGQILYVTSLQSYIKSEWRHKSLIRICYKVLAYSLRCQVGQLIAASS